MSFQPPPDTFLPMEPRDGFHVEWAEKDGERLATAEERATRKCRRPGCQGPVEWAFLRKRWTKKGHRYNEHWWLYCVEHNYGRKIVDGKVLHQKLVRDDEAGTEGPAKPRSEKASSA